MNEVDIENIRLKEYSTLRDEILQNKKYIFERPLLIITAAWVASIKLSGEPLLAFLPPMLVVVLLSNLWFTVNRLESNARIIAYITLVLEPISNVKYIGWENSLRIYRIWKKKTTPAREQKIQEYTELNAIPDAIMFYPALWWLHMAIVAITLITSAFSLRTPDTLSVGAFVLTLLAVCFFSWYCFGANHPDKMRNLIELQRATWKAVFEEQSNNNQILA